VQLRQEAQQWKDQCLRLDQTLRGEIKSWKDQFLCVDAEHTRLLNQQLSSVTSSQVRPQLPPPPLSSNTYPPHPQMIPGMNPQTQATLIVHTPKHVPFPAAGSSATSSATKRSVSASSSNKDKVPAAPSSPTKAPAFPRIVHRVQAVIKVPVKEEEEEGGCIEEEDNDHLFDPDDGVVRSRSQPDPAILYPTSTPTCTRHWWRWRWRRRGWQLWWHKAEAQVQRQLASGPGHAKGCGPILHR